MGGTNYKIWSWNGFRNYMSENFGIKGLSGPGLENTETSVTTMLHYVYRGKLVGMNQDKIRIIDDNGHTGDINWCKILEVKLGDETRYKYVPPHMRQGVENMPIFFE